MQRYKLTHAAGEHLFVGNHCHEKQAREFLVRHWLTPDDVKFYKKDDLIIIEAKKKMELEYGA